MLTRPAFPLPVTPGWSGRLGLLPDASNPAVTSNARQSGDGSSNTHPKLRCCHHTQPSNQRAHSCRATSCRTEKVEALYQQQKPAVLPAIDEPAAMRKLRAEHHSRMLGNGYCSRPVDLDCHYETICESCTFFVTTIEFRPTLQAQRDDAATKGQTGRQKVYDGILQRLEQTGT